MSIGKNMQRLRAVRNWTQRETADKLNLEKSIYSRYEGDFVVPSVIILMNIANLFGVSLDELTDFVPNTGNRMDKVSMSMYRLKEMGIKHTVNDDAVDIEVYGNNYQINLSDVTEVVSRADLQYDTMLVDINKGLYNAALSLVLAGGDFNYRPYNIKLSEISDKLRDCLKNHKGKITPEDVVDWFKDDFLMMMSQERKVLWDVIIEMLSNLGKIKHGTDRWECPFVDNETGK